MRKSIFACTLACVIAAPAGALTLESADIQEGKSLEQTFLFNGFGCSGENLSPQLSWKDVPQGSKSLAITVYDPDAPSGSGWHHWVAIDIPISVNGLERGQGTEGKMPQGSRLIRNDFSIKDFGGACPPQGHGVHRYQFTLWALPYEKMAVPDDASAALVGFMLNAEALSHKTITTVFNR